MHNYFLSNSSLSVLATRTDRNSRTFCYRFVECLSLTNEKIFGQFSSTFPIDKPTSIDGEYRSIKTIPVSRGEGTKEDKDSRDGARWWQCGAIEATPKRFSHKPQNFSTSVSRAEEEKRMPRRKDQAVEEKVVGLKNH